MRICSGYVTQVSDPWPVGLLLNFLIKYIFVMQAMSSPEEKAYEIMRELDVNYVLVIFGGLTGYSSDGKNQIHSFRLRLLAQW